MRTIGEQIQAIRKARGYNQDQLAELASLNRVTVAKYESGKIEPGAQSLARIADALGVSMEMLLGKPEPDGRLPIVPRSVPIVGTISCGEPILAEQNIDGYADLPEGVRADFALRCKGDSMAPTILDGDLALIRAGMPSADRQIIVALIEGEATLKRIYHQSGHVVLTPDNPAYHPILVSGEACIQGVVVGFVRMFRE